jgi:hypothetical protein
MATFPHEYEDIKSCVVLYEAEDWYRHAKVIQMGRQDVC